jgi:large subunit ribosomal protein L13
MSKTKQEETLPEQKRFARARQNKTLMFTKQQNALNWFIFDASGKTLGRFASEIAKVLRGKNKPTYTPNADLGDGVIVINADKIVATGRKPATKVYYKYTGYVGGLRETTYREMLARKPEYIIEHAIHGMLPKSDLGHAMKKRLRVFKGTEHDMAAQKPIQVNI